MRRAATAHAPASDSCGIFVRSWKSFPCARPFGEEFEWSRRLKSGLVGENLARIWIVGATKQHLEACAMLTERLSISGSIVIDRALDCLKERAFQMLYRMQQYVCALQGHNLLLHLETNRLSLRCATCGWDTPGWNVAGRANKRASLTRRSWELRDRRSTPVSVGATAPRKPSHIKRIREVTV